MLRATLLVLLFISVSAMAQSRADRILPRFQGRVITITESGTDPDGFYPKGPATVCLQAPPQKQCYTAPEDFGRNSKVAVVELKKNLPALLVSAESGGVSGFRIHFALLRPGTGKNLEDLLMSDASVSNQSQSAFWNDPAVSDAQFFITANFVWGPDEGHYSPHRYIISVYVLKASSDLEGMYYYLQDRYMTSRSHDLLAHADILASEKAEILARLRRLKLEKASSPRPH